MIIIASEQPKAQEQIEETGEGERLSEVMPKDFNAYFDRWLRYWPRKDFYIKRTYDRGFFQPKNKKSQAPLKLFPSMQVELAERHLDTDTWQLWKEATGKTQYWQGPSLWLGLNMPKKTTVAALDLDNSLQSKADCLLGYYHWGRKLKPVVRLPLAYCQRIKRVYEAFPGRLWCISSDTLGLHAWEKLRCPTNSLTILETTKAKLKALYLPGIEAHPMPGRCLRRPFGEDYRTITERGLLTAWFRQSRYFEAFRPDQSPTLADIIGALLAAVEEQWQCWLSKGEAKSKTTVPHKVIAQYQPEIEQVKEWLARGCPDSMPSVVPVAAPTVEIPDNIRNKPARPKARCPYELDAMRSGKWPLELERIATSGLPAPKSLGTVCHELAKWLYWVELYNLPPSERTGRIQSLIMGWLEGKHNGYSSRASEGDWTAVAKQVNACVQLAVDLDPECRMESLELFARIRQKRQQGRYRRLICLEPFLESVPKGGNCI